jgi:hypothetical protein
LVTRPVPDQAPERVLRRVLCLMIHVCSLVLARLRSICAVVELQEIGAVPALGGVQSVLVGVEVVWGTLYRRDVWSVTQIRDVRRVNWV